MNATSFRAPLLCGFALLLSSLAVPAQDPTPATGIPECAEMHKTASGLEWGVLQKGTETGNPGKDDQVEVRYTGWLTDGTKFDSSRDRKQTATFGVGGVIKGWTEGLQLMTPGARYKLVIPGDLAYGPQGRPPKIPANATLVFDVELVRVIQMPKFRPANADKQNTLESGVKWEVLTVGTGKQCTNDAGVAFRYAIWDANGTLLACTERDGGRHWGGAVKSLDPEFLRELAPRCKVGDVLRVEAPEAAFPRARRATVWELELLSLNDVPVFRPCDPAKIVKTQTGLQYEVIAQGEGDSPKATDTVVAHYTGWLTDGTVFDSSHARGEPTEFPLNRVIKGWTEGLQLMQKGGKYLFTVPPELGYGAEAQGSIPANSTLVFLVELVDIKKRQ
ncbi:MAG: FKBP-type peptidyl-prolyl cis-trans isomerase [Planctomycetes bacterium]|nr:FKBP-type peptidyl-prolyl cis-trans isomerase [Planctomycetota bacterium]